MDKFQVYKNPSPDPPSGATQLKQFQCAYCGEFPKFLLALWVELGNDTGRVLICEGCLKNAIIEIDQARLVAPFIKGGDNDIRNRSRNQSSTE